MDCKFYILNCQTSIDKNYEVLNLLDIYQILQASYIYDLDMSELKSSKRIKFDTLVTISDLQNDVFEIVKMSYKDSSLEHKLLDGLYSGDIYIPDLDLIIEVDGPSHYKDMEETLETKLRNRIYEKEKIKFISIPYYEWDNLSGVEKKKEYLSKKLY